MKKIVVLYHNQCWDGFGAAWAAWKRFKNTATYIGVVHNGSPPKGLVNKEIYLIDFCYPKEEIAKLSRDNRRVVVLDHHITRKAETEMMKEHVFDNNHSGSYLAWRYFFPKKKVPNLILYVQDNDLWKFKIKKSKEIMLAVNLQPYSFESWNKISRQLEITSGKRKFAIQGDIILSHMNVLVDDMTKLAAKVRLRGVKALAVNGPRFVRSELGNKLTQLGVNVGIVWRMDEPGKIHVDLRSNGKVDVAKLAEKYGGGGHKNAAGFAFKSKPNKIFPWKLVKK